MQAKVSVGPATYAGYGATVVGLVATGLAVVFNVDQEQAAVVAGAAWTVVAFSWTQWGRYVQARDAAREAMYAAERSSWDGDPEEEKGYGSDEGLAAAQADTGQTTTEPRPSATVRGFGVLNEMAARAAALPDEHREEGCANPFTEVRHGDE
jgi:hypothetical protein